MHLPLNHSREEYLPPFAFRLLDFFWFAALTYPVDLVSNQVVPLLDQGSVKVKTLTDKKSDTRNSERERERVVLVTVNGGVKLQANCSCSG